jgi:O-antigen/teichoic acid export membrane protein
MSLRKNIAANFFSQMLVAVLGIVMVPQYLAYMGAEAYGLVGFFAMLIAWFNLLDLGLTPTMARETARFRGGAIDALSYRRFVRSLEGLFLAIGITGGSAMLLASSFIAERWLQASQLQPEELRLSIQLMGVIAALRWMCGLYRGAVNGSERMVWLGGYNACVAILRFVGVLPVLIWVSASPTAFFMFQLGVAVLELAILLIYSYRLLPVIPGGQRITASWAAVKPSLRFSMTIAFTSSVWVSVTQTDKLVLSKLLPLADYGYFTLAVLVASGVSLVAGPVNVTIAPRMAKLVAENNIEAMLQLYRQATQLILVITGATAASAALFAEPLLWTWTGDALLARQVAPILALYALGNCLQAITTLAFYLQYAKGDLRLHLMDSVLFVFLLIPGIVWAAERYSALGAGYVWLGVNLLNFLIYVPLVHRRFKPGLHVPWLVRDVLPIGAVIGVVCYALHVLPPPSGSRWMRAAELIALGSVVMLAAALASAVVRRKIGELVRPGS